MWTALSCIIKATLLTHGVNKTNNFSCLVLLYFHHCNLTIFYLCALCTLEPRPTLTPFCTLHPFHLHALFPLVSFHLLCPFSPCALAHFCPLHNLNPFAILSLVLFHPGILMPFHSLHPVTPHAPVPQSLVRLIHTCYLFKDQIANVLIFQSNHSLCFLWV